MKNRIAALILFVLALAGVSFAQTLTTFTSPTTALGAGTPSRQLTVTQSGTSVNATNLTFSDGGAGGTFYPATSIISSGQTANGTNGNVYIPSPSASGSVTLTVTASGSGATGTATLTIPISNNASIYAQDNFSGSAGTTLAGRTPTVGAAWAAYASGATTLKQNGSNGVYQVGSSGFTEYAIPTNSNTTEYDVTATVTNANFTTTQSGLAVIGSNAGSLNLYRFTYDCCGTVYGWGAIRYVGNTGTTLFQDASTSPQISTGGTAIMRIAVRQINSTQYLFFLVNGVMMGGAPVADSSFSSTRYPGLLPLDLSSPATTDTVWSNFYANNVDWSGHAITASPSTVPRGHSGNISLTLTGTGTSWTSSTTFSISGVTGASVVSKTNISSTSETLVIATGSGTGTLTITGSDGSAGAITVATPVLAVSPTTAPVSTSPTITATGTNTIWSSETASTLFSVSGCSGASISSISVSSNTAATFTLTMPATGCTATITDTSVGTTATVTSSAIIASVTPSTVPANHSGTITLAVVGSGTSWTGSPFSLSSCPTGTSLSSQSVTSTTATTLNVVTGSGTGSCTISDGTHTINFTVATSSFTISPTTGATGSTPTLTITGSNTAFLAGGISFSVSGGTGSSLSGCSASTNTAASCNLTVGTTAGPLTITDGTVTGSTATFTATMLVTFPNSNITVSPYNWRLPGDGSMWAVPNGGAYFKFSVTGVTSVLLNVDTTINSGISIAGEFPAFIVSVDNGQPAAVPLTSGATQITLASGLSTGVVHTIIAYTTASDSGVNAWSATTGQIHITGLLFSGSPTLSSYPTVYTKNCAVFGDSYEQPYYGQTYSAGSPSMWTVSNSFYGWSFIMGRALGCEVGVVGIGGQAIVNNSAGWSFPVLGSSWNYYDSTHARSFSPTPDYLFIVEGINDHGIASATFKSAYVSLLTAVRSALSTTKIFAYIPTGGQAGDEDGSGGAHAADIRAAVTTFNDSNTYLVDTGTQLICANNWSTTPTGCPSSGAGNTWFNTSGGDALHPAQTTQGILAGYAIQAVQKAVDRTGTTVSPVVTTY